MDKSEYFSISCVVCVIRFKFSIHNISLLQKVFSSPIHTQHSKNTTLGNDFSINYYRYLGEKEQTGYSSNINRLYNQNKPLSCYSLSLNDSSLFQVISESTFYSDRLNRYIFEIEFDESDVIDMRYIYMVSECFTNIGLLYQFRIFKSFDQNTYIPIPSRLYQQIRTFLLFGTTNNNLFFYAEYSADEHPQWQRLFKVNNLSSRVHNEEKKKSNKSDVLTSSVNANDKTHSHSAFENIGRIFPLLPISKEVYSILQSTNLSGELGMEILINKYQNMVNITEDDLSRLIQTDSCFEKLFFLATCSYISEEKQEQLVHNLEIIHERCVDYAQGIMQAVENAYVHAVNPSIPNGKDIGCASLAIRIRKKETATYLSGTSSGLIDSADYFIEVYVYDLLFKPDDFVGIVERFIMNSKRRYSNTSPEEQEKWSSQCGSPDVWIENNSIALEDMFNGGTPESTYRRYLLLPTVIAYHYGLQIFNNVVLANDGFLEVWSKKQYIVNDSLYESNNTLSEWNGTTFTVYIPLHTENEINYADTIADSNYIYNLKKPLPNKPLFYSIGDILNDYNIKNSLNPGNKNRYVLSIKSNLSPLTNITTDSDIVYTVDCAKIENQYSYEILAKAIFLILADEHLSVNNVALLNVKDKYNVIKLFRQFALFYNREGKNEIMKTKNVYIVDCLANLEIAFGGRIDEIITNVQNQLLIGGVGEATKKIIYHLGGNYRYE